MTKFQGKAAFLDCMFQNGISQNTGKYTHGGFSQIQPRTYV